MMKYPMNVIWLYSNKRRSRFAIISLYLYLIRSKTEVLISTLRETSILSGLVSKLPFIKQKIVIREASQFVKYLSYMITC